MINDMDEFIINRMAQAKSKESSYFYVQEQRWKFLDKLFHGVPVTREEKMDFIRFSLEAYRISDTTIDILVRKFIRFTLPEWAAFEFLSKDGPNGHLKKVVHSVTTPGLSYTTTLRGCNCPGYRGNGHCKHHDEFVETHVDAENIAEEKAAFKRVGVPA